MRGRIDGQQILRGLLTCMLVATWTLAAIPFVVGGLFGAADTSCDGGTPQVNMEGGWLVIVAVGVWDSPFAVNAVRRRSVASLVVGLIATAVAAAIVVKMFADPGEFCF